MIQVKRGNAPKGFVQDSRSWSSEFQEARKHNPDLSPNQFWTKVRKRNAMRVYAQRLYKTFHGKCAFCESRMRHVSPAHIEHYRPKSRIEFQGLMFDWDNWLLTCTDCNTNKGTYFDDCNGHPCLIDPSNENPDEHIAFLKTQILYKTDRGKKTITQVKLNRIELIRERAWWLVTIDSLLLLLLFVPEIKAEVRALIIWALQDDAPYAAMTRAYLQTKTPALASPAIPHPPIEPREPIDRITELLTKYKNKLEQLV